MDNTETGNPIDSNLSGKETSSQSAIASDPASQQGISESAASLKEDIINEVLGRLSIGDLVDGKYEVLAHIGSGGMGEVYKVKDRDSGVIYALKMISPLLADQKTLAKRLEHEARAARTLVHGNIVAVYDVGNDAGGAPYLLMDFVEGDSLESLLKTETVLTPERALHIFLQIAEALVHAHQKGIVHRDLKPSNILMTKTEGGLEMVKIVDFGIAKVSNQEKEDKTKLTQTGELLGTPLYMSPEQCTGEEIDARSDIYSFGCIMYETLTGKNPFAAENAVKVILKHLSEEPPPLPVNAGISGDLKQVVMRCLEKHRSDRYANPVDLHIDLERIANGIKIAPYQRKKRPAPVTPINPKLIAAVVGGVLLLGVAGFMGLSSVSVHSSAMVAPAPSATQTPHRPDRYGGKSLAQWTAAIEKSPDDPLLYASRAELHSLRDERTNAIDDYNQAISLKPSYIEAYKGRAFMYVMIAQYDKAALDANKIISLAPLSDEGYQTRGWVYSAREQFGPAIADWQKAIKLHPTGYSYYNLGSAQMKMAYYKAASESMEKSIEMENGRGTYRAVAGLIDTFQQKYDQAYEQLKEATAIGEQARGVEWHLLAYYYLCVGKTAEAQQALEQAKQLETFPARSFRLAGEYYRTAGQFEKAIQEFSASTSLEEYPPGYRERAVSYMNLGQWRSAYGDLKKSLQLNPYSSTTLSFLALCESQLGMKPNALEHIASAFKDKDTPPIVFVNRARIHLNNGDVQKASSDTDKAISMDPFLKEGYELRSAIRDKTGDKSGASSDKEKANKLFSHLDY